MKQRNIIRLYLLVGTSMISPTLDLSFGAIVEVKDRVVALLVADNVAVSRLDRSHVDDCCFNP